ncbi:Snf7-domain-containing protein [Polychytrium aggregatum]|uniref:Snf7-domain-containing protein n=1 Tax=Polychytrium aggregatum TaxID=110093 RepID=UPI0022FE8636|nr:Snf7-domain-containing protein [Polychytrium aggregatum]KAI9199475.1 Snf7-domain-containing protein [Polychytrium aggregatum]
MSSSTLTNVAEYLGLKRVTPEEQVKRWRQSIRGQERELDKQIRNIEAQEVKVKRSIKDAAKRNDRASCKLLAKEIVRSRKAKDRLHTSKAQLNSMVMQLQQQLAAVRLAGSLQKSTEVMKLMNRLIKLPELSKDMQQLQMEMTKAGVIEEMLDDTLEMDEEEIEDEAEEEVNKVLFELTDGRLGEAGAVGAELAAEEPAAVEETDEAESMAARLQALRAV